MTAGPGSCGCGGVCKLGAVRVQPRRRGSETGPFTCGFAFRQDPTPLVPPRRARSGDRALRAFLTWRGSARPRPASPSAPRDRQGPAGFSAVRTRDAAPPSAGDPHVTCSALRRRSDTLFTPAFVALTFRPGLLHRRWRVDRRHPVLRDRAAGRGTGGGGPRGRGVQRHHPGRATAGRPVGRPPRSQAVADRRGRALRAPGPRPPRHHGCGIPGGAAAAAGGGRGVVLRCRVRGVPAVWSLFAGATLLGVGAAFLTPAAFAAVFSRVPPSERGSAAGTASLFIDLGLGGGPVVLGLVAGASGIPAAFLAAAGLVAAAVVILAVRSPERRCRTARTRGRRAASEPPGFADVHEGPRCGDRAPRAFLTCRGSARPRPASPSASPG